MARMELQPTQDEIQTTASSSTSWLASYQKMELFFNPEENQLATSEALTDWFKQSKLSTACSASKILFASRGIVMRSRIEESTGKYYIHFEKTKSDIDDSARPAITPAAVEKLLENTKTIKCVLSLSLSSLSLSLSLFNFFFFKNN
jgi:hypothetical protein